MAKPIACPAGASRLSLGEAYIGRRVRCPQCKQILQVGDGEAWLASAAPQPAAPPPAHSQPQPASHTSPPARSEYEEPAPRPRRRRRFHSRKDHSGLSAVELLLFGGLFLFVPIVNVIVSSVLYYVWRRERPSKATQVNVLGFVLFGLHVLVFGAIKLFDVSLFRFGDGRLKEFTSTEGRFKIMGLGKPDVKDVSTRLALMHRFGWNDGKDGSYPVAYADRPFLEDLSESEQEARLSESRDGALAASGSTLTKEVRLRLEGKYLGREIEASFSLPVQGKVRARIYIVGTRLYTLQAVGRPIWVDSSEATRFLESFELLR